MESIALCIQKHTIIVAQQDDKQLKQITSDPSVFKVYADAISGTITKFPYHIWLKEYSYIDIKRIVLAYYIGGSKPVHSQELISASRHMTASLHAFLGDYTNVDRAKEFCLSLVQYRVQLDKVFVPSDWQIMRQSVEEVVRLCRHFDDGSESHAIDEKNIKTKIDAIRRRFGDAGMRMLLEHDASMNVN